MNAVAPPNMLPTHLCTTLSDAIGISFNAVWARTEIRCVNDVSGHLRFELLERALWIYSVFRSYIRVKDRVNQHLEASDRRGPLPWCRTIINKGPLFATKKKTL